jgi:hypothetical protein
MSPPVPGAAQTTVHVPRLGLTAPPATGRSRAGIGTAITGCRRRSAGAWTGRAYLILGAGAPILVDASFRDAAEFTAASGVPRRLGAGAGARPTACPPRLRARRHRLRTAHAPPPRPRRPRRHLTEARILIQRAELQYAAAPQFPVPFFDRVDVAALIGALWDPVELLDGEGELFTGVRTAHTGGHTPATRWSTSTRRRAWRSSPATRPTSPS